MAPAPKPAWLDGLTHKDWMFDGSKIKGDYMLARFENLDWSRAWVDMGPSVAGNPGPYWHVPFNGPTILNGEEVDDGDTTHRLYPKLLQTKWLPLVRQAMTEMIGSDKRDKLALKRTNAKLKRLGLKQIPLDPPLRAKIGAMK